MQLEEEQREEEQKAAERKKRLEVRNKMKRLLHDRIGHSTAGIPAVL